MANLRALLAEGSVVNRCEGKSAFDMIDDMVTEWERETYPDMTQQKLHKRVKHSPDRLKLICHLNNTNVIEADRICTFKLIASTKDNNDTAIISKNVCLDHSCRALEFHERSGGPTGRIHSVEELQRCFNYDGKSAILNSKKGRHEKKINTLVAAFHFIKNHKMYPPSVIPKIDEYLDEMGMYEPSDLRLMSGDALEFFATSMKEVPRRKLIRLLTKVCQCIRMI